MRALVCGGRNFNRLTYLVNYMDHLHAERHFSMIITGGAPGVDKFADYWANMRGIDRIIFPANWSKRGKSAGPYRNHLMLEMTNPKMVIAFSGENGTANMVKQAAAIGLEIITVPNGDEP